ncbi:phosphonopyruvate decarboxylase, partial [Pseudoflavonifractor sp. 524-17]|uniref:phosphonopyruvate decarboxylase n=1 Tax=Pseudoflavonifractor sp. 524-17 TaxID=2304577 RepID=UPI00137A5D6A
MEIERFAGLLEADFYAGVPDSQLKALCSFLMDRYGLDPAHHVIAANEGNAAALAAGYHLATGKVPVVYLQNSGLGNVVNPAASLLNEKVYGIPCLFVVGWRGEPGVHDEPQHLFQGEITLDLLNTLDIPAFVVDKTTAPEELADTLAQYRALFARGRQAALVVRRGALEYGGNTAYGNPHPMSREEAIRHILAASGDDAVVATTGKASRELYELREGQGQDHSRDFLTVGSMGHSSSIALGIALQKPGRRVWCLDGDGAALMHLGAMAVIGASRPDNLIHVVLNNEAHESVGGMPTVAGRIDFPAVARACGYPAAMSADCPEGLEHALKTAKAGDLLAFIEVKCALGARANLRRPNSAPRENKA